MTTSQRNLASACLLAALLQLAACSGDGKDGASATPAAPVAAPADGPQWVSRSTPNAKVALVFVHGLFGDTLGTWTGPKGVTFFDLVKANPKVGDKVDVFAFGFTSKVVGSGSLDVQAAANKLYDHLKYHGVTDYPAIVFVAHSMGGLVSMRMLLTHRDFMARVPVMVLYASPQAGADVARIVKVVAKNPALANLLPPEQDSFLKVLNDDWRAAAGHPPIRCAHENKPTYGVMIVDWSSATRFCDGPSSEIAANHIDIVKPDRAEHDSVVVLVNALEQYVTGRQLEAKLETPDFVASPEGLLYNLSDPNGRSFARLVNAGGGKLRYTLAQFSDDKLYVWPETPREILPNSAEKLVFALGINASASEYRFVLQSNAGPDRTVVVRVADREAVAAQQASLAAEVRSNLAKTLDDRQLQDSWKALPADSPRAQQELVEVVRRTVAARSPELPDVGQWMLSAELLNTFNWPTLAAHALRNAEKVSPQSLKAPGAMRLSAVVAAGSGESGVLAAAGAKPLGIEKLLAKDGGNLLVGKGAASESVPIARKLQEIPSLRVFGSSLLGDIHLKEGDRKAAAAAYESALNGKADPSLRYRLSNVKGGKP